MNTSFSDSTTFPIDAVRARFPALSITDAGRVRVYLDNPAGTQVPQSVADAVSRCLIESNANLGGTFPTTRAAEAVVNEAHAAMADFLGAAGPEEVIIGANMTTLTLHLSRSICRSFEPGDEIIVTRMDHEGDISPWLEIAADKGLTIRWLPFNEETWQVEPEALAELLNARTRLLALNYASNLTGSVNEVAALTALAKEAGALVYIDAVQLAPHRAIDVQAIGCDFLACSSYKFFGPHLGILWGRRALLEELHAYKCRCSSDALPEKFETGTPQIELLAGLSATVAYYEWLGGQVGSAENRRARITAAFAAAQAYEDRLAIRLIEGLDALPGITIQGITNPNRIGQRVPTVSCRHETVKPAALAQALVDENIFVWAGHNYALEVVRQLGIPDDEGVLRIGIAHYNTEAEVDAAIAAVARAVA